MANAYSLLNNFDAPLYSPDFQSISKALTYKQNKLDMNRAALDQVYENLTDLDILKGQDKEYANKRIAAVTKLVNQYANQDLSNDGLAKSLQTDLSQILDDNVKNAVYSTAVYRAEEQQWSKLKEKNPEKFADQNYWYAHKGFNNYMNDGKVGSKYSGGGGVIEYQDVAAKINKNLPLMLKDKGVDVKINEFGKYYWDKTKTRDINESEVMSAIQASLGEKDKQQLQINANYDYKDYADSDIFKMYDNNKELKIKNATTEIKEIDIALKTNLSKEHKDYYESRKGQLESYKNSISTGSTPPRSAIENSLYSNDFFKPFKEAYSVHEVTDITRIKDELSFKVLDNEMELSKIALKHNNAKELITWKNIVEKKKSTGISGGDITGGGIAQPTTVLEAPTALTGEEIKPHYSQLQDEIDGLMRGLTKGGVLPDMYSYYGEEDKTYIDAVKKITRFDGVVRGKSADGTKNVYFVGWKDGKEITQEMTAEQAADMMKISKSFKVLGDTEKAMVSEIDKSIEQFKTAFITADDINRDNLLGFNMRVQILENGDKKLVPVSGDQNFEFKNLAKKVKQDPNSLSPEEKETLDLYVGLDVIGGLAEKEENAASSVTIDAAQIWLRETSRKYKNGGQFISDKPNDYNIYQESPVQQIAISDEMMQGENLAQLFSTTSSTEDIKWQQIMAGVDIVSPYVIPGYEDIKKRAGVGKVGDVDLSTIKVENNKQAYDKIKKEFFNGKNVLIMDNTTGSVRVDKNIQQLMSKMIASGKDISNYNFSDTEKEFIYRANTQGVGRSYTNLWKEKEDATAYDLDEGDLERRDIETGNDISPSFGGFKNLSEDLSKTLNNYSDNLAGQYMGVQQKALIYNKDTESGELIMSDIANNLLNIQDKKVNFGDNIQINYKPNGDVIVYGDIYEEGEEKEWVPREDGFIFEKHNIPKSIPREDTQETTLFDTSLEKPDSRMAHLQTKVYVPSIVDFVVSTEEAGSIDKKDFENFVTNVSNNGMVYSFEPLGNEFGSPYGSTLKFRGANLNENNEYEYKTIVLENTGLPKIQEKGEGSVQDMMEFGSNFNNILQLYPDQVIDGLLELYREDLAFRRQN